VAFEKLVKSIATKTQRHKEKTNNSAFSLLRKNLAPWCLSGIKKLVKSIATKARRHKEKTNNSAFSLLRKNFRTPDP
jgi:ribosome-associated translation inhibitor RaiA